MNLDTTGTIFHRKRRGRKMTFMVGGPTLQDAPSYVRRLTRDDVFFFASHDGELVGLVIPIAEGPPK